MKLLVPIVLCVCIVQICFVTSTEFTEDKKDELRKHIREVINGVSEQFIEDVLNIGEKYQDNFVVHRLILHEFFSMLASIPKNENTSKIDANGIKKFNEKVLKNAEVVVGLEYLKIFQLILSKRLPTEKFMGVINLFYVIIYPNATTEEVKSGLNYLYGTGNIDIKDHLINIPAPNATDCPQVFQRYSYTTDGLKSMTDIKPTVLRDVLAIAEKFPCVDHYIQEFLENFMEILWQLRAFRTDESTISACLIKENPDKIKEWEHQTSRIISSFFVERNLKNVECILLSRLPNETYRNLINFERSIMQKTSINDIQQALEYVFIDLPETNCTVEHGNEAK